jgi:hypothetical protein
VKVTFDTHELTALIDDMEAAAAAATAPVVGKVVEKAALNIKNDARRRAGGLAHAPAYPRSITYDAVRVTRTGAATEVGPDKDKRQGALGNILEYGTRKNAPIPHLAPAAEAEEPRFARALEELAAKAIEQ